MYLDSELILTGSVYGLTFLVGMIGNSLIVYSVVHFRRMKSLSNIFLASLATADLILVIFCVPVKFAQLFSYTWNFGSFLCKFVHYIQNLSAICSVYTLTAISIERYYAIMYPVECRYICTISQTKRIIMLTWVASIILAMPVIWIQILREVGDSDHRAYWCVRDWDNDLGWRLYELYMLIIILIIPLIIMTYSYAHICNRLYWVMHNKRTTSFPLSQPTLYIDASVNKMSQVIKMLIVVVIIFVLCWTPILVIGVLQAFQVIPLLNYGHMKAVKTAFHLFSYANSCVNPIIYGFMSRNFRASFKAALFKCLGCSRKRASHLQHLQQQHYQQQQQQLQQHLNHHDLNNHSNHTSIPHNSNHIINTTNNNNTNTNYSINSNIVNNNNNNNNNNSQVHHRRLNGSSPADAVLVLDDNNNSVALDEHSTTNNADLAASLTIVS